MKFISFFKSKQLKFAAIGSLSVKFLSALFAFFNGVLLARVLEIEDFAIYILAFTTVNIAVVPLSIGFPELITRYVSMYMVNDDKAAIKGLLRKANTYILYGIVIFYLIVILTYLLWWKQYDESTVKTFWYGFLLTPLLVLGLIRAASLRGIKLIVLGEMPDTLVRNFLFATALSVFLLLGKKLSPEIAMLLHVAAALIAFIIGFVFLKKNLLNDLKGVKPIYHSKDWLRAAIPYTITQWVSVLKTRSIPYILAFFGSLESVALFDVAMRGATLVSFTLSALNTAISPYLSAAFSKGNLEALQRIITKSNRVVFFFSMPVALIFIVWGNYIIPLIFGEKYILAYTPLIILCLAQLVNALTGACGPVLNMTGNQSILSKNQILMMLLSFVLSIPLVIYLDEIGAAISFGLVLVIQNLLLVYLIRKRLSLKMSIF